MAGGSLGSLTIDLAANITRFERSLTRAEKLADKRAKGIERTFKRMASGIAAALVSFGFVRAIESSLDFADSIGKAADRAGLATTKLQEYRFAADQFGISTQQMDDGLRRFTRRLGVALDGGSFEKDFVGLGVAIRDSAGNIRESGDVLDDVVVAMGNLESAAQKSKVAAQLFGDDTGPQLALLLGQGEAAINGFAQQARDLGLIMDEDLIRNAEAANDELSILGQVLKIEVTEAIVAMAPQIKSLATDLINITKSVSTFFASFDESASMRAVEQIERLQEQIELAQVAVDRAKSREDEGGFDFFGLKQSSETAQVKLDELQEKLLETELKLGEINQRILDKQATGAGEDRKNMFTGMTAAEMEADLQNAIEMGGQFRDIFNQQNADRLKSEETVNKLIINSKFNAMQNAVGFLQTLGQRSKTAALAALVLQKGLAIAQTIVSTQAASMRAMAELGPIAGPPAVASIQAMGAASVGLIAATGLLQAGSVGSNSAGGVASAAGTVADPIITSDINQFATTEQAGTRGTITINVSGVITEDIIQDLVIPAIQDATNDKDVILFRSDSRQAIELEA